MGLFSFGKNFSSYFWSLLFAGKTFSVSLWSLLFAGETKTRNSQVGTRIQKAISKLLILLFIYRHFCSSGRLSNINKDLDSSVNSYHLPLHAIIVSHSCSCIKSTESYFYFFLLRCLFLRITHSCGYEK